MAGCCGKPSPHGAQKPGTAKPSPQAKPTVKPSTSMAGGTQSFTLAMTSGERHTVKGSLLEAQAKLARLGGRGQIKP